MTREEIKQQTKTYGLRTVRAVMSLPRDRVSETLGAQWLRSGTSVGANYRAACRAKSNADFVNKLKIVEEECDESLYWMEIITESGLMKPARARELMKEGNEILSIVIASIKTARVSGS